MSLKITKIYTSNPYVDEMVYYTKLLGLNTILKNQTEADNCETLDSVKAGSLYIACYEGSAEFWKFSEEFMLNHLTKDILLELCDGMDGLDAESYAENPRTIPNEYRTVIAEYLSKKYIEEYVELNKYYRMLNGLPPITDKGIKVSDYYTSINGVVDTSKYLHELSQSQLRILDTAGVLDTIYNEDKANRAYVLFLLRKTPFYEARTTGAFEPLYIPSIDSTAIREMYIEKLSQNKRYLLQTVYSEAYKYDSDYYDNFMCVFIVMNTMVDVISRVQEFITRKEIFDIRSCEYLFESFGVPFFDEIPLKYQINMVKNIHTLLKYKSTAKCMIDICTLFGFDNIKVFKYYLLKCRSVNTGNLEFIFHPDYNNNGVEDENYSLKFLKLPLDGNLDEYIRVGSNYVDYDEITLGDPTWDGGLDHEAVKQEIIQQEFNYSRTKYISLDSLYDIIKLAMQQAYFFNMLYDNIKLEEEITLIVPFIDAERKYKVADIFTLLTILSYQYRGIKDTIMDTQGKVLHVLGFNFKADLAELSSFLQRTAQNLIDDGFMVGSTADAIKCLEQFIKPDEQVPSFNQLMNMFTNNLDIRDLLISGMEHADNLRIFLVFKKLYDSLMITELDMDYYKNPETGDFYRDEEGDATFTEYLKHREIDLYSVLLNIDSYEDPDSKREYISNLIDNITLILSEYIDTDEFGGIFSNLPMTSAEAVKKYIVTVINFYKSFKVDFLGVNTIYYLDDKLEGTIKIIDDVMDMHRFFTKKDYVKIYDFAHMLVNLDKTDRIDLIDKVFLDITSWLQWYFKDKCIPEEKIGEMRVYFTKEDFLRFLEITKFDRYFIKPDYYKILDCIDHVETNFDKDDSIRITDKSYIVPTYIFDPEKYILLGNVIYFEIPYVKINNGVPVVIEDDRIDYYKNMTVQFVIYDNYEDLVDLNSITTVIDRYNKCTITLNTVDPTDTRDIYGRLIISYNNTPYGIPNE